ncbi:unnamed protein product [Cuscuta epithymum]|uniref:Uncharacterized protein n=1 Tax=Cuscuta epithymum TaxID=186058 RepID=A0AAV0F291_9ASTE|nr:unnamed protein product [Cuscuta epithymum]
MQCAEESSFQSEVPIVVSVKDNGMFTQDTQATQLTTDLTEERQEREEASEEDNKDQTDEKSEEEHSEVEQRTTHGIRISYGPSRCAKPKPKKMQVKKGPRYATRSRTTLKSVLFGNDDAPIDLD